MKPHPTYLPLAFLALSVLSACNLTSNLTPTLTIPNSTSTAGAVQATVLVPTDTLAPETVSPTPKLTAPNLTSTAEATQAMVLVPTGTLAAETVSPTPFDVTPLPSVGSIGRLSLTQGWVSTGERLLWTKDAGGTWFDITPTEYSNRLEVPRYSPINPDPFFFDGSHAWLPLIQGQEEAPPTRLWVFFTDNGGRNWASTMVAEFSEPHFCPGPACLGGFDLDFVDPKNGWLAAHAPLGNVSDFAFLYRTRDGGQTWSPLTIPIVGRITFIDASTGWASGGRTRWISDQLLRTQDGGDSWEPVSITLPEAYAAPGGYEYQEPVFLSHEAGLLPVRFYNSEASGTAMGFYTTQDGGGTWSLAAMLEEPDLGHTGSGIPIPWSVIDESTWYVSISEAKQYLTRDQGQTWEIFPAVGLGGAVLMEVQFASEAEGWALGLICTIDTGCSQPMFATHDGGRTWKPIVPAP